MSGPIDRYEGRALAQVEAAQLHPIDAAEIAVWCGGELQDDCCILLPGAHGRVVVEVGDFVVKDVRGEFKPYDPEVFHHNWRRVTTSSS